MQKFLLSLLAVGFTLSLAAVATADQAKDKKKEAYGDISVEDLKKAIDEGSVTVIDVNGTDTYAEGHIPGAIDFEANADKLEEKLPKEKDALIVAYCGGPQCNAYKAAAKKAVAMGYTNVKHLSAGISGWKNAGHEVEKAG